MRDDNYILIPGWAVNKLKLKGNTLLIFSIIHGFSRDGESEFTGSLKYLCDSIGATKPTVISSLKELVELGHVNKRSEFVNGVQRNMYSVVLPDEGSKDSLQGKNDSKDSLHGGSKDSLHEPSKDSLHNNTNTNTNLYTNTRARARVSENTPSLFSTEKEDIRKKLKIEKYVLACSNIADEFEFSDKVYNSLVDFFRMLAQQGAFLPEITIKAQLQELYTFADTQQLQILSQTIKSGWRSLQYAAERLLKQSTPSFDTSAPGSFQPKDPNNDRRAELYEDDEVF